VQIIEVSVTGVRSAVLPLRRRESPLRFVVYPMVHIAEPRFYRAVAERLRGHDLIVAEGIAHDLADGSAQVGPATAALAGLAALTATYQLPAWVGRAGLVEQDIDFDRLGVPVVYPDLTSKQFAAGWQGVPAWQRALAVTMAPLEALDSALFGSRRALARNLEETDERWRDRLVDAGSLPELEALLLDDRDRLLMAAVDQIHRERHDEDITVAVVYGAAHVAPLVHGLRALHGYRVRAAEWLTVFDFD
jgi:hypothetical protein